MRGEVWTGPVEDCRDCRYDTGSGRGRAQASDVLLALTHLGGPVFHE